jgi:putative membrane protein
VAPQVTLDARHASMLNQLAGASGPAFDVLYGPMQVMSHQEAVAMFAAYAQGGADPGMRAFAQQVLPSLQMHLKMARRLPDAGRAMVAQ